MSKTHRYEEDDDAFDENGILKDGHSVRYPTWLMDSPNQPGFIIATDAARATKQLAYDAYEADLTSAWQTDGRRLVQRDPYGRLMSTLASEEPDDKRKPSKYEWEIVGPLSDATEAHALKDAAYAEHEQYLRDAWKGE